MSDNVNITEGSGAEIAADEIAGVKHQRVKVQFGADGNATDVSSSNKLPVDTGLTQPTTPSDTQPVSVGSLPLPSGASTSAKQDSIIDQIGLTAGIDYDYLDVQQTDADTETFVFKTGGSGGTTVRTIVVNYTSSAKTDIDNVSWG